MSPPMHFARERQAIFRRSWQMLGRVSQVAARGQYVAADIAGDKVFVDPRPRWQLRGFRNVCRHRGAMLLADGAGQMRHHPLPLSPMGV